MAQILNSMANFNERTIEKLSFSIFRKFQMGLPENQGINFAEWNTNSNYIAVGGAQGMLRVVRLGLDPNQLDNKLSNALVVNQTLEGHNVTATVLNATWNENNQKLTTSDTSGLIIVWGIFNEQWYEEMINNRNKSVVVGIVWNNEGTKIAIAYADGTVIVGTLEGNRIWNKEFEMQLACCEWAPEGDMIIFGTAEGKVIVYDEMGNHHLDIPMVCLDSVELEVALIGKEKIQKEEIICMRYWSPTLKSKAIMDDIGKERKEEEEKTVRGTEVFTNQPVKAPILKDYTESDHIPDPVQPIPPDRPRFLVAYARGLIQLMHPIVVRIPNFNITGVKWSPNGAFIAVCGEDLDKEVNNRATIHFLSAYGQFLGYFRTLEYANITSICWEATGLIMIVVADGNLLVGTIRPEFKWGIMEDAVVYVYQKEDLYNYAVMFYDYKTDEKTSKILVNFEQLACHREHCILINRQDDGKQTQYFCQLCNNSGTALDYNITTIRPKIACVNSMAAVITDGFRYFIWHFVMPKANSMQAGVVLTGKSGEFELEEQQRKIEYGTKRLIGHKDEICAICIGDSFFLMALQSGGIYRVSLLDGVITTSYPSAPNIELLKLNCKFNRVAIVTPVDRVPFAISFYEFVENEMKKTYSVERKEIWGFEWDADDENMLAFRDRTRLFVYDGTSIQEQSQCTGIITYFQNLIVTAVQFDKLLLTPENPPKSAVQEISVKARVDVNSLLSSMKVDEAIDYAERNSHTELWKLIATYAMFNHKWESAEHCFVKLGDYYGVELIKKLRPMATNEQRNAELYFYKEDFETAENLFMQLDRRDLAVEMYSKVGEVQTAYDMAKHLDNNNRLKTEAQKELAEFHFDNLDFEEAAKEYTECGETGMRIESLINANLFGELEVLSRTLPDDSPHLERLGDAFQSRGMGDQAVECFLRKELLTKALNCCMELNQWQKAHFIAESNHMDNVEGLLGKFVVDLKGENDEKSLSALSLYMRAGRHLDAATIAFDASSFRSFIFFVKRTISVQIAKDRQSKFYPYEELKECYVLGAILVEQHRVGLKELKKIDKNNILDENMDEESGLSAEQSRILENTWRGAEAFHFMILAQQHFFDERVEDALQTSVVLSDYEEYLDPAEVHSMIALAAANVRQFGICSKAMMRLETMEDLGEVEKDEMRSLSFQLFSDNPPVNPNSAKVNCPSCETKIDPFDLQCYECHTKFPVCIASGRLIIDNVFWLCPRCKHRAHQHEISKWSYCPLCHDVESFKR
ncbi:unnamed protein product [Caenorhabditis sp. 36 PRJEB53466]|nr:unnamed protein product [Caenorhabditis sp. 36 PRJEB53466]